MDVTTSEELEYKEAQTDDNVEGIALVKSTESDENSSNQSIHFDKSEEGIRSEFGDHVSFAVSTEQNKEAQNKQNEKAFRKQLNKEAREIVAHSIHNNVKLIVHRPDYTPENQKEYESMSKNLLPVIREIARKTIPLIEHEISTDFAGRHYYGNQFRAESLGYLDFRYFSRKLPPSDSPSLVVGVRVDESKSMIAAGRLEAAKRAAIAIYEFCMLCDIPVLISGDTADVSRLEQMSIFSYADFAKPDRRDRYRLMGISARNNNRDGMALRIMADRLAGAEGQTKLLISISDGQPKAMESYTGEAAAQDMKQTMAEFERKGVRFVAAAIGQDKEIIGSIYGDGRFLNITDLNRFPAEMVRYISRYL
ncbi:nitric oxide reductase activation protein NorD [Paenibacillus sp. GD4]|uniref:vWA domain-containing protein n=1 Tax=Paenibacillus sp. GD4 TaxID=3068890 RepID=UPI002796DA59|nr:nitric oxide reductase activation protein NorD [Paenibacillus sp. GD4]MDQ1913796.1 nitric oxide reductase activation protein NorD [Paenibacillus sp. GD4]